MTGEEEVVEVNYILNRLLEALDSEPFPANPQIFNKKTTKDCVKEFKGLILKVKEGPKNMEEDDLEKFKTYFGCYRLCIYIEGGKTDIKFKGKYPPDNREKRSYDLRKNR